MTTDRATFDAAVAERIREAAKTEPMTDWGSVRSTAYEGRYLWGGISRFGDDQGVAWLKAFKDQAPEYGAEVVVEGGYVYVTFPEDMPNV